MLRLQGISSDNIDRSTPDGQLAYAANLIPERGALRPILTPAQVFHLPSSAQVLIRHLAVGVKNGNYIYATGAGLFFASPDDPGRQTLISSDFTRDDILGATVTGATVTLSTSSGLQHLIWRDGKYTLLPQLPDLPKISFGLQLAYTINDTQTYEDIHQRLCPGLRGSEAIEDKAELNAELELLTNQVYGHLLPLIQDRVTSKGYFWQPFFIRYAFRLFDGSYIWHSAPVLMLPTTHVPLVSFPLANKSDKRAKVDSTVRVNTFALMHRIFDLPDDFSKWRDIITAVDIFVSAPIYTFDQSKPLQNLPYSRIEQIYYLGFPNLSETKNLAPTRPGSRGDDDSDVPTVSREIAIEGTYRVNASSPFADHPFTRPEQKYFWAIQPHENFAENLRQCHAFYRVASISFDKITSADSYTQLKLDSTNLSSLVTLPTLPDDYQSHCRIIPGALYSYNNRLNVAVDTIHPAPSLPLQVALPALGDASADLTPCTVTVLSRHNGVACYAQISTLMAGFSSGATPRYLFIPDPEAYRVNILSKTRELDLDLEPHSFLNGAYYLGNFDTQPALAPPESELPAPPYPAPDGAKPWYAAPAKLYTSEAENPFCFPLGGITTVGNGIIRGLSSAARALSQGQFGEFPLYVFTTEGVWALSLNSDGTYAARQPITRDVLFDSCGLCQLDASVAFTTRRGVMLLSGSQVETLTAAVDSPHPFAYMSWLPQADASCSFREMLPDMRLAYDYKSQRIWFFAPGFPLAFVLSLESRQWGSALYSVDYPLNAYPDALVVSSGKILDLSTPAPKITSANVSFVTRPLSLGDPDQLKTIRNLIMRGRFDPASVRLELRGVTSDGAQPAPVAASANHRIAGISGSPYRQFIVSATLPLPAEGYISALDITALPKFTDKPR